MEESKLTRRCEVCGMRFDGQTTICPIDRRPLSADDPTVPDLGNYRLIERIGDGGMGAVYRAIHRKLGRTVAIKVLQRDLSGEVGLINRFFHEARAANTIRHPHVIEVYDFVETGHDVYFVMEYLRGEDLHDAIHRRDAVPMSVDRAVSILEQVASGLQATHARQIVHRDIKPENIFLAEKSGVRDFVKLFDYGVAKLDRPDGRMTIEGAVLGTPEYMSPEQARGQGVDGRSDIYSLGCVAYEMLTRQHLFKGKTQVEVLTMQIHRPPPPLRQWNPSIPVALDEAVQRALAKSPADRPQNALAFAESITKAIGRGVTDLPAFTGGKRAPSHPTPTTGMLLRASENRSAAWKPVGLAVMAATLLTGAVVLGKRGQGHGFDPPELAPTAPPTALNPVPPPPAAPPAPPAPPPAPEPAAPRMATVILESRPSGAKVLGATGKPLGATPYRMQFLAGGEQQVWIVKPGYQPVERRFVTTSDVTISVDLEKRAGKAGRRKRPGGRNPAADGRSPLDSPTGTIDPFAR